MEKCLNIEKKYEGCYVALISEDNPAVVGSGTTPLEALEQAQANGFRDPLFFFVPQNSGAH